jgi:hypothetical protein
MRNGGGYGQVWITGMEFRGKAFSIPSKAGTGFIFAKVVQASSMFMKRVNGLITKTSEPELIRRDNFEI